MANSAGSQSGFIYHHADDPASIYKERLKLRNGVGANAVSIEHAKERNLIFSFFHGSACEILLRKDSTKNTKGKLKERRTENSIIEPFRFEASHLIGDPVN